jgi:hypothetical protein
MLSLVNLAADAAALELASKAEIAPERSWRNVCIGSQIAAD